MKEDSLPKRYIDQLPEPNPIQPQVFRPQSVLSLTTIRSLPEFPDESTKQQKTSLSFDCCDKEFFDAPISKNQTLWQHHYDNQLVYMRYDLPKSRKHFATLVVPFPILSAQTKPFMLPGDITFDSCFESGNLLAAYKITDRQYNLVLQNDVNSKGNTQWFFFSVKNKYSQTVRFNIINLTKEKSLYQKGLQPLVCSENQARNGVTWHHEGMNIQYQRNNYQRSRGSHFTLSFTYTFPEPNDTVYFAHSYPYTLTRLHNFLSNLQSPYVLIKKLCETIAGNVVHSLTITDNQENDEKQGIVLQARQHPGETTGSFLMEGCLQFLNEETFEAQYLRRKFVFRCFPMLNPDGVVNGNYRCNLSGVDINRRWVKPSRISHPCIHAARQSVKQFHLERQISLILDFHAHSKKFNTFFYGNDSQKEKPLLDTICTNSQYFSLEDSKFQVRPFQEQTARVALWKLINQSCDVYTVETSFFGYEQMGRLFPHSINDLKTIGRDICMGIFRMHYQEPIIKPLGVKNYFASDRKTFQNQNKKLTEEPMKKKLMDDNKSDTSMSESGPSEDELTDRSVVIKTKKKKRQTIRSRKNSQEPLIPQIQKSQNRSNSEQNYLIEKNTAIPPTQFARIKRLMADTEPLLNETAGPKFVSHQVKIPQQNLDRSRRYHNQQILQHKQLLITPQKKCFSNNNSPTTEKICTSSLMRKPIFQPLFKLRTRQLVQSPPLLDFSLGTIKQYDALNISETQSKTTKLQSRVSYKKLLQKRTSLDDSILNPLAKRFIAFMNR